MKAVIIIAAYFPAVICWAAFFITLRNWSDS